MLKEYKETDLVIEGHTDNTGKKDHNKKLSVARADPVIGFLTANGVEQARLTGKGYADERPVAENTSADGRQAEPPGAGADCRQREAEAGGRPGGLLRRLGHACSPPPSASNAIALEAGQRAISKARRLLDWDIVVAPSGGESMIHPSFSVRRTLLALGGGGSDLGIWCRAGAGAGRATAHRRGCAARFPVRAGCDRRRSLLQRRAHARPRGRRSRRAVAGQRGRVRPDVRGERRQIRRLRGRGPGQPDQHPRFRHGHVGVPAGRPHAPASQRAAVRCSRT